jgi:DNA polymerase-3 subunit chi
VSAAPCEVWFYHLERTGLDQALPELLDKTLARGWRALVRATGPERLEHLDGWLWSYRDDSFLPHGLAGEPNAARQPVLLTTEAQGNPNQADALFLIDGAEPGAFEGYARCLVLFDGKDEEQLALARRQWSALKAQGAALSYWKQGAQGGWEKQA